MTPLDQQQQQRQQAAADLLAHESQLDPEKAVDRAEVDGELEAATAEGVSDEPYAIYRRFPRASCTRLPGPAVGACCDNQGR